MLEDDENVNFKSVFQIIPFPFASEVGTDAQQCGDPLRCLYFVCASASERVAWTFVRLRGGSSWEFVSKATRLLQVRTAPSPAQRSDKQSRVVLLCLRSQIQRVSLCYTHLYAADTLPF